MFLLLYILLRFDIVSSTSSPEQMLWERSFENLVSCIEGMEGWGRGQDANKQKVGKITKS